MILEDGPLFIADTHIHAQPTPQQYPPAQRLQYPPPGMMRYPPAPLQYPPAPAAR